MISEKRTCNTPYYDPHLPGLHTVQGLDAPLGSIQYGDILCAIENRMVARFWLPRIAIRYDWAALRSVSMRFSQLSPRFQLVQR